MPLPLFFGCNEIEKQISCAFRMEVSVKKFCKCVVVMQKPKLYVECGQRTQPDAISNERYTCWGNKDTTHSAQPFSMLQCDLLSACFCFHNSLYRLFSFLFRFVRSVSLSTFKKKSTEGPHTDTHLNLVEISIHVLDITTGHKIAWKLIVHANALSLWRAQLFFAPSVCNFLFFVSLSLQTNATIYSAHCKLISLQVVRIEWETAEQERERERQRQRDSKQKTWGIRKLINTKIKKRAHQKVNELI